MPVPLFLVSLIFLFSWVRFLTLLSIDLSGPDSIPAYCFLSLLTWLGLIADLFTYDSHHHISFLTYLPAYSDSRPDCRGQNLHMKPLGVVPISAGLRTILCVISLSSCCLSSTQQPLIFLKNKTDIILCLITLVDFQFSAG